MIKNSETHILKFYRLSYYLYTKRYFKIARIVSICIRIIFSAEIPASCKIGKGVQLKHGGLGIVLHDNAVIGDGSILFHNVTIGGREKHGTPTIGKNVYIGCGASILGNVYIGDNARIGANSVVLTDVKKGDTVVGIPAKVKL